MVCSGVRREAQFYYKQRLRAALPTNINVACRNVSYVSNYPIKTIRRQKKKYQNVDKMTTEIKYLKISIFELINSLTEIQNRKRFVLLFVFFCLFYLFTHLKKFGPKLPSSCASCFFYLKKDTFNVYFFFFLLSKVLKKKIFVYISENLFCL